MKYQNIFILIFFTYMINFMGEVQFFIYELLEININLFYPVWALLINALIVYITYFLFKKQTSSSFIFTGIIATALLVYNYFLSKYNLTIVLDIKNDAYINLLNSDELQYALIINRLTIVSAYVILLIKGIVNRYSMKG